MVMVYVAASSRGLLVSMHRCFLTRQEQADLELAMRLQREEEERAVGLVVWDGMVARAMLYDPRYDIVWYFEV